VRDDYDLRNLEDRIGGVLDNVPHKKGRAEKALDDLPLKDLEPSLP